MGKCSTTYSILTVELLEQREIYILNSLTGTHKHNYKLNCLFNLSITEQIYQL